LPLKEGGIGEAKDRHDERAVKVVVAHLTEGLGKQCTTVARSAVKPDRIIRTKRAYAQRLTAARVSLYTPAPKSAAI
jgi:hypothetical protein